jgi:hypothetical protein
MPGHNYLAMASALHLLLIFVLPYILNVPFKVLLLKLYKYVNDHSTSSCMSISNCHRFWHFGLLIILFCTSSLFHFSFSLNLIFEILLWKLICDLICYFLTRVIYLCCEFYHNYALFWQRVFLRPYNHVLRIVKVMWQSLYY